MRVEYGLQCPDSLNNASCMAEGVLGRLSATSIFLRVGVDRGPRPTIYLRRPPNYIHSTRQDPLDLTSLSITHVVNTSLPLGILLPSLTLNQDTSQ